MPSVSFFKDTTFVTALLGVVEITVANVFIKFGTVCNEILEALFDGLVPSKLSCLLTILLTINVLNILK